MNKIYICGKDKQSRLMVGSIPVMPLMIRNWKIYSNQSSSKSVFTDKRRFIHMNVMWPAHDVQQNRPTATRWLMMGNLVEKTPWREVWRRLPSEGDRWKWNWAPSSDTEKLPLSLASFSVFGGFFPPSGRRPTLMSELCCYRCHRLSS